MNNSADENELNIVIEGRVFRPGSIEDRIAYAAFLKLDPENSEKMIRIQEDEEDGTFHVITDEAWEMLERFGTEGDFEEEELTLHRDLEQAAFHFVVDKTRNASPPAFGELMIIFLCPKNRVEPVLGDLAEQFRSDVEQKGIKRANLLYLARAVRSCPLLVAKVRNTGFWLFVIELGRRLIGS